MSHLVVDVGTSNLRTLIVRPDGSLSAEHRVGFPPTSPFTGAVEFDPIALAKAVVNLALATIRDGGPVSSVGITTQRASTIVWDRATGVPVGPGIGWQDLRTAGMCVMAGAQGVTIGPNQSATKAAFLLDSFDPERSQDLCFGTVDSWIVWTLTDGAEHIIETTNAGLTGLIDLDEQDRVVWDPKRLEFFRIPPATLPRIVSSTEVLGAATRLPGSPVIAGIAGDQQSSLLGQACVSPGLAKITFGTGAMLDMVLGSTRPVELVRSSGGTFPIVTWTDQQRPTWGLEAIALAAGSSVAWLVEDLGVLASPAESADVASSVSDSDGVMFVPALLGLGTPQWDYGARGVLLGMTRGTTRGHIVRAVLEGIAQQGADLVDAAEADAHLRLSSLRIDGGMSANPVFVQALADACHRPIEVSPMLEATALGAGYLSGLATGTWSWTDISSLWQPAKVVEPSGQAASVRARWHDAVGRSKQWLPDLSALNF